MKELADITLTIEQITFEKLTNDPQIILDQLHEVGTITTIKDYIINNIEDKDGLPEIKNFQIKNIALDPQQNQGKFRLSFDIELNFCCSGINSNRTDYLDFDFHITNNMLNGRAQYFNWELNN